MEQLGKVRQNILAVKAVYYINWYSTNKKMIGSFNYGLVLMSRISVISAHTT